VERRNPSRSARAASQRDADIKSRPPLSQREQYPVQLVDQARELSVPSHVDRITAVRMERRDPGRTYVGRPRGLRELPDFDEVDQYPLNRCRGG
jgi:hypothetical protein